MPVYSPLHRPTFHRGAVVLSSVLLAPAVVAAEDTLENELETVVVTASGYEQTLAEAPASISVLDRQELISRAYRDLTDALQEIPGVTVTGTGSSKDISIRGMPAQYTLILVDGRRQTGRESQPNGSGGFEQDWLPPVESIERIEVVSGPMSSLYGSDAIGGVINVITRKNAKKWTGRLRLETIQQENSDSGNHYQGQAYLSGPLVKDLVSLDLTGIYQKRHEDMIERGYPEKEFHNFRGRLRITPTEHQSIDLEYARQEQTRTALSGVSLPSRNQDSETKNDRTYYAVAHNGRFGSLIGQSFFQVEAVDNVGRDIEIRNTVANTQWSLPLGAHFLSLGANYQHERLEDVTSNQLSEQTLIKSEQLALFAEDTWTIADAFSLTLGARVDDNDLFDTHVSPRLYGVWTLRDNLILKGGISTGYRAPNLREITADWGQESRGGDIYGNPDLQPETSTSKELSLIYQGSDNLTLTLAAFHNKFDDKISRIACPADICSDGPNRFGADPTYRVNIDEAVTYGGEVALSANILETLSINTSYTYKYSEQKTGEFAGEPLTEIPRHLFRLNTNWQPTPALNLWNRITYRGKEAEAPSSGGGGGSSLQTPSFTFVDMGGSYKLHTNLELLFGVYNIFDKKLTYDEYGYVEDGRRYWLGVSASF